MSLLLDALKKAAQENQSTGSEGAAGETGAAMPLGPLAAPLPARQAIAEDTTEKLEQLDELELHDEVLTLSTPAVDTAPAEPDDRPAQDAKDMRVTPTPSTVSDEALQLLIHKTNHAHKRSRLMIWSGVVATALTSLSAGGLYFYFDMVTEIETMKRKHQIALAALESKTRIEENLTSLAAMPEPASQPVSAKARQNAAQGAEPAPRKTTAETRLKKPEKQAISVQRAEKRDPVSVALQRGWAAYQDREYALAKLEYSKATRAEPKNRDALLGLAAVSLQQDDTDTARDIYIRLLELDPRDPQAHAGLANIVQRTGGELSESRLKQLIEYQPDDEHLQFVLGNLHVHKKNWPEAQQAFFKAWQADSTNPDYAYNLAVSLDRLGKHKVAVEYYQDSLKLATGKNISFSVDAVKSRLAYLGTMEQP